MRDEGRGPEHERERQKSVSDREGDAGAVIHL